MAIQLSPGARARIWYLTVQDREIDRRIDLLEAIRKRAKQKWTREEDKLDRIRAKGPGRPQRGYNGDYADSLQRQLNKAYEKEISAQRAIVDRLQRIVQGANAVLATHRQKSKSVSEAWGATLMSEVDRIQRAAEAAGVTP